MAKDKHKPLLSPLRYPGSKRWLTGYIHEALEVNALHPALYIEPFVGGGSVALRMLQSPSVAHLLLMDLDPWVASLWHTVFFDTDWLVEQVATVEVTLAQWERFKTSQPTTQREQALTCLFLNRTSFSGILERRAGPLGGREQASEYKIDCRFPRETLIRRIEQIAALRDKVKGVWCCSWDKGMARLRQEQHAGFLPVGELFFYFDPPFFEKANALYRFAFVEEQHQQLRDFLLALEDKWILSYDSAQQVEILYGDAIKERTNGARRHQLELKYTLGKMSESHKRGREVIISNLAQLPELDEIK